MKELTVSPVMENDLGSVSEFLNKNMNQDISPHEWKRSFHKNWTKETPNFGFQLKKNGLVVGVICAIYSDQLIAGKIEKFCNPHSWCVLEEHRQQSINLVMAVIKQNKFHYTMFTPNPTVAQVFQFLKFKKLSEDQLVYINYPSYKALLRNYKFLSNSDEISGVLSKKDLNVYKDHYELTWLKQLVFGKEEQFCHVIYKTSTWKRIPFAHILYVSNIDIFIKNKDLLGHYLLLKQLFFIRVDNRFFPESVKSLISSKYKQPRMFFSDSLKESDIQNIYSELVALDI